MSPAVNPIKQSLMEAQAGCSDHPFVSIVVCTRGLRASLERCLDSLVTQGCPRSEILVVLNNELNQEFVRSVSRYPVRVLNEPRPGVCAARNYSLPFARGGILAFVDDDVVAYSNWLHELVRGFEDRAVACVTGRVVPKGQSYFDTETAERYYASKCALSAWTLDPSEPNWYQRVFGDPAGFGCNMAFRRSFLESYALFPEDLGAGSLIGGGDDFYMFIQVVRHGFRIHHNGAASVAHFFEENRAQHKARISQLYAGNVAFALKLLVEEKGYRIATLKWLSSALKRRIRMLLRKTISSEPKELLLLPEKLRAYLRGPWIYWKSRRALRAPQQKC